MEVFARIYLLQIQNIAADHYELQQYFTNFHKDQNSQMKDKYVWKGKVVLLLEIKNLDRY